MQTISRPPFRALFGVRYFGVTNTRHLQHIPKQPFPSSREAIKSLTDRNAKIQRNSWMTRRLEKAKAQSSPSKSQSKDSDSSALAIAAPRGHEALMNTNPSDAPIPPLEKEVYRCKKEVHQRVFQWGIGNKFKSTAEGRVHPVHVARPVEVSLRNDYYDSPNPNIKWEDLNEAWEVYWYEHKKLHAKPFPVKKWGIEAAKREALAFWNEIQAKERDEGKPKHESGVTGVEWDETLQSWVAFVRKNGRPTARTFNALRHGFEESRELAIWRRNVSHQEAHPALRPLLAS